MDKLHLRVSCDGWRKDQQDAWLMLTAMSASIGKCYFGIERILKNLLQELDGSTPSSLDGHDIERAASLGPYGRPPLLGQELSETLQDLRSFKSRDSTGYVSNLDPAIVVETSTVMVKAVQAFGEFINRNLNLAPSSPL